MMKKLYLSLLSLLFGTMLGFSFVKGDIIDLGILAPEEGGAWHVAENTIEGKNGDKIYGRLPGDCENRIICFFSQDVGFDMVHLARRIAVFLICVFLLIIISVFPLYNIFKKLGEKGSKALIPIKNVYCLANLVNTRKLGVFWGVLAILWFFIVSLFAYSLPPCWSICNSTGCSRSNDVICGFQNMCYMFSMIPAIIIFLIYDYFALLSFYCLFKKFGWNKWCSLLGTIFFLVGACVLGFGNFEYQGENLEKKEKGN